MLLILALAAASPSVHVVDGDTIRRGKERIRLLGIDAPEMHGCPKGRVCASGNPQASKASLAKAMRHGPLTVRRVTKDRYGRTVALVYAGKVNLSCEQLRKGMAVYVRAWDNRRLLAKECRHAR